MDKVIIDGVDVSGCEFCCENPLHKIKYSCNIRGYEKDNGLHIHLKCKDNQNCYYKQLKRLQAENKKLKYYLNKIREDELNSMDVEWDEYITECTSTEYTNVITFVELALGERDE